jgi:hypothetical protein
LFIVENFEFQFQTTLPQSFVRVLICPLIMSFKSKQKAGKSKNRRRRADLIDAYRKQAVGRRALAAAAMSMMRSNEA